MHSLLLSLVCLVSSQSAEDRIDWIEIETTIEGDPSLPPFDQPVVWRDGILYSGVISKRRLKSVHCLEQKKLSPALRDWITKNVLLKTYFKGVNDSTNFIFELRISNMSSTDLCPAGYSFWKHK